MARNSTGIYRRGAIWWITWMDAAGVQQRESTGSKIKADADYLLVCRKKAVAEGLIPVTSRLKKHTITFDELAERYLAACQHQKSHRDKKSLLNRLKCTFGPMKLIDITREAVERYQSERQTEKRLPKKEGGECGGAVKPATVNRELATLKHMFSKAEEWGLIPDSSLKGIRRVKLARENNKRLRFLSVEESRLLVSVSRAGLRELIIFALNTGCRRGEIFNLKWEHVDLKHGFIRIADSKNGESRDIPINSTLAGKFRGILRRLDSPSVIVNPETGTSYQDVKHSFATACRKAGIMDFKFHDLRHTFASQLVMGGADLTTVSRLLGHKSLAMTLRYSHLAPDHLKKAVDLLTWGEKQKVEAA
ncbi:MAG: tyrosine-type recombinase/integrase [Geobacter sp.]